MTAFKIWGCAQLFTAIAFVVLFREFALIPIGYAVVGGLPALALFEIWTQSFQRLNWTREKVAVASFVILSSSTALCSFGLAMIIGDSLGELYSIAAIPVIATIIATCLFLSKLTEHTQQAQQNDSEN